VNFPVQVNTNRATYEIQYGNVERSTSNNNSWEVAQFETCGHKWADLSENGLGISLLNDSKYGYGIKDGEMSLTLIKSGTYPNENADIGTHDFTYSIYPHNHRWQEANTVDMAYNLNVPCISIFQEKNIAGNQPEEFSLVSCSHKNCFIETMKKAEDGIGWILRMYENQNTRVKAEITFGSEVKSVTECDLMENGVKPYRCDHKKFQVWFEPYEIKTFRIEWA
jgi:alpha-mannosidase